MVPVRYQNGTMLIPNLDQSTLNCIFDFPLILAVSIRPMRGLETANVAQACVRDGITGVKGLFGLRTNSVSPWGLTVKILKEWW
ncbi:hypothetical protein Tco_1321297 [Tanacetum coccineum]